MTGEQIIGLVMIVIGVAMLVGIIWFTKEPENIGKTLEDKNHLW